MPKEITLAVVNLIAGVLFILAVVTQRSSPTLLFAGIVLLIVGGAYLTQGLRGS